MVKLSRHSLGSGLRALALLLALGGMARVDAATGVGGNPQACFRVVDWVYGPAGGPSITFTFDPTCTYLPTSPSPGQIYLYRFFWDYGDGTRETVPADAPGNLAQVLVPVIHTYAIDQQFTVQLRVEVTIVNADGSIQTGPVSETSQLVQTGTVNFPPDVSLVNQSSPATGSLPYEVAVSVNGSRDRDGYILYTAIDWGDGRTEVIPANPPLDVDQPIRHTYTTPGVYKVTLSVIDNGRLPLTYVLPTIPSADNIQAAWNEIIAQHRLQADLGLIPAGYDLEQYEPRLSQDYFFVQVPGNLRAVKGQFKLDFVRTNSDSFDLTFQPNAPPPSIANTAVVLTLQGVPAPATGAIYSATFTTDGRGAFRDAATGLSFDYNGRKQQIRLRVKKAALAAAFNIRNEAAFSRAVDVRVRLMLGATALETVVRFDYSAENGRRGVGKNAASVPTGN